MWDGSRLAFGSRFGFGDRASVDVVLDFLLAFSRCPAAYTFRSHREFNPLCYFLSAFAFTGYFISTRKVYTIFQRSRRSLIILMSLNVTLGPVCSIYTISSL